MKNITQTEHQKSLSVRRSIDALKRKKREAALDSPYFIGKYSDINRIALNVPWTFQQ